MPRAVVLALLLAAVAGCASLPSPVERTPSHALADTAGTRLGHALAPLVAAHAGMSGIHALSDGRDAFAARVLLAHAAERSLDVQYYIYRNDITGQLLCEALWQAAERGVRVRLLIDDNNTKGLDAAIAALDAHPNIEVRLFNPYANRGFRLGELMTHFSRVNRRMHNKSFTADNQVAIVGGRNVGDEYYGAESAVEFADLDALAAGTVVREVSAEFDAYWNSESAYPVAALIPGAAPESAAQVREAWARLHVDPRAASYVEVLRATPLVQQLLARSLPLEWTTAHVVADDPAKVLQSSERTELHLLPRLTAALGKPQRALDLVSPYFVPGEEGTAALGALAQRGVKVRVLTNSLAATDVAPVHAGYAKYRKALLRAGVRLYELKPSPEGKPGENPGGSDASLHAKTFAVDRSRIFVGSFNFDPRSARLNTEMGVVIESSSLASQLSSALDDVLPRNAYELRLVEDKIQWIERDSAGEEVHASEPGAGFFQSLWIGLLSLLPIEWLL